MAHLIDKDVLVAEIERRKNICKKVVWDLRTQENKDYYQGKAEAYSEMVKLIDTLEVKEVDLEKSISDWLSEGLPNDEELIDYIKETAEHFFELSMSVGNKALKGE